MKINVSISSDQGLTKSKLHTVSIRPKPGRDPDHTVPPAAPSNARPPANGNLRVTLDDQVEAADVGDTIVYTLMVTNDRQVFDSQVQLTLRFSGLRYITMTENGQTPAALDLRESAVGLRIGEMRDGESRTFRIETKAILPGEARVDVDAVSLEVPDGIRRTEITPVQAN